MEDEDIHAASQTHLSDLNFSPHSPSIEASQTHLFFDLNSEPNEDSELDETEELLTSASHQTRTCKNLTNDERRAIYNMLLAKSVAGTLKHGTSKYVASLFSVNVSTVQRIWRRSKTNTYADVSSRRPKNCGRKRVEVDLNLIRAIPLSRRTTLRSLSHAIDINTTTLHALLKEGSLQRHSNAIKPTLTKENQISRIKPTFDAVEKSFDEFSAVKSNRIFVSLQLCMIEIMKSKGSQGYKISHINKALLERQGRLPTHMKCESTIVQEVADYLRIHNLV